MSNREAPFLHFYGKNGIIPTHLEVPDIAKFYLIRDRLFETIGVAPSLIKGCDILEVGPGSGEKTTHLLSKSPNSYTAVEGNPASAKAIKNLLLAFEPNIGTFLHEVDFLDFESETKFDFVIAENVVPFQIEPSEFLLKLIDYVRPGGLLIFNCVDGISMLSESLRRILCRKLNLIDSNLTASGERIADFFSADLGQLPGMNREKTDWAIDQMIHPFSGKLISISESLNSLMSFARYLGSSPSFYTDWRWYKDTSFLNEEQNQPVIDSFSSLQHNLIDNRETSVARSIIENNTLNEISSKVFELSKVNTWDHALEQQLDGYCKAILQNLSKEQTLTRQALKGFCTFLETSDGKDLTAFRNWWGRSMQYVSVVRI